MKINKAETERAIDLEKNIPEIWNYKTFLYIGASKERFHYQSYLMKNKCCTDVLEIDKKRCKGLKTLKWLNKIICLDVRDVSISMLPEKYDVVLWSHGPEILNKKDIKSTIDKLIAITKNLIVIMTPWGEYRYKEGSLKKKKAIDINVTPLYENDFSQWGFDVSTIGEKDLAGSNLLAWKYINNRND